jgi:hypothetical protein
MLYFSAFAKLRKATISFGMSVRLSVRMEQLGCLWTDFRENLNIFLKSVENIQVS